MKEELEIVYGKSIDDTSEFELVTQLKSALSEGTLFLGLPSVGIGDTPYSQSALYLSRQWGLHLLDFSNYYHPEISTVKAAHDLRLPLYSLIKNKVINQVANIRNRVFLLNINVIIVHESENTTLQDGSIVTTSDNALDKINFGVGFTTKNYYQLRNLLKSLYSRPKPDNVHNDYFSIANETGFVAEESILENLEFIKSIIGPQIVKGLAGTGKTTLLAYKAAFLHFTYPEWQILFTFQTRSQYKPLKNLIGGFFKDFCNKEPDWNKLNLFHAWGGLSLEGTYEDLCDKIDYIPPRINPTRPAVQYEYAYSRLSSKLLYKKRRNRFSECYDAVLIDEAQDFPPSFFRLVCHATKHPRRITIAFDELQNFENTSIRSINRRINKAFRTNSINNFNNHSVLNLTKNYRNSSSILNSALALALGSYRNEGSLQVLEDTKRWRNIGTVKTVTDRECGTPKVFQNKINSISGKSTSFTEDSIRLRSFPDRREERQWISQEILKSITVHGYRPEDNLIIVSNPNQVYEEMMAFAEIFYKQDFGLHAPGFISSQQNFSQENSIPIVSVNRAKGEEVLVAHIIGAEHFNLELDLIAKRKMLYTALTRSIDVVRVSGVGFDMSELIDEYEKLKEDGFLFSMKNPTKTQIAQLVKSDNLVWKSRVLESKTLYDTISGNISIDYVPDKLRNEMLLYSEKVGR